MKFFYVQYVYMIIALVAGVTAAATRLFGPLLKLFGKGGPLFKVFRPLTNIFGSLTKVAPALLKVGKFTGVVTAIMALVDFVTGFANAADILGKDDVSLIERFQVAATNIITSLLEPIDWLAEKAGFDLFEGSKDDLTKKIVNGYNEFIMNIVDKTKEWFTSLIDGIGGWIDEKFGDTWIGDQFKSIIGDSDDDEGDISENDNSNEKAPRGYGTGTRLMQDDSLPTVNSLALKSMEKDRNESTQGNGGGVIVAPSSNQTNVSNNTYGGSKNSNNNEPTHRRFKNSNMNGFLAY